MIESLSHLQSIAGNHTMYGHNGGHNGYYPGQEDCPERTTTTVPATTTTERPYQETTTSTSSTTSTTEVPQVTVTTVPSTSTSEAPTTTVTVPFESTEIAETTTTIGVGLIPPVTINREQPQLAETGFGAMFLVPIALGMMATGKRLRTISKRHQ